MNSISFSTSASRRGAPRELSSSTRTALPSLSSAFTSAEPMKPLPPVTRIRAIAAPDVRQYKNAGTCNSLLSSTMSNTEMPPADRVVRAPFDGPGAGAAARRAGPPIRQRRPPRPRIRAPGRGAGRDPPRGRRDQRHRGDHACADGGRHRPGRRGAGAGPDLCRHRQRGAARRRRRQTGGRRAYSLRHRSGRRRGRDRAAHAGARHRRRQRPRRGLRTA